ncbi:MAG TPA: hypothetical protein VNW28_08740 [Chthoniobacterales bacterium]|nr:hypothetical protein [Chthoniobacterales bacterium]
MMESPFRETDGTAPVPPNRAAGLTNRDMDAGDDFLPRIERVTLGEAIQLRRRYLS